mmetsp:Transcript_24753/g.33963  ORF Transcript_24753/g.33963 Transcript_24753/m.33963 type:complete len:426 (-) Transcript_24753:99-1376(-)
MTRFLSLFPLSVVIVYYVEAFSIRSPQCNKGITNSFSNYKFGNSIKQSPHSMCVGTEVVPTSPMIPNSEGMKFDSDPWQTVKPPGTEFITPFDFSLSQLERPVVMTFSCWDTLIEPSQSVGRWYREALNTVCNMQIRLPRPTFFTKAFNAAFAETSAQYPCFGARNDMTSRQWWDIVIEKTYRTTEYLTEIESDEWPQLLPELTELLYEKIFNSGEGWAVKEDVEFTLQKLRDWRDLGGGPRLGVIDNFDDRLDHILTVLGLRQYFDFVLTSRHTRSEKPAPDMFQQARQICGIPPSSPVAPAEPNPNPVVCSPLCVHVGVSLSADIAGAASAGFLAIHFSERFEEGLPDWAAIESEDQADEGVARRSKTLFWGRRDLSPDPRGPTAGLAWLEVWGLDDVLFLFGLPDDPSKPLKTTYMRAVLQD